MIGGEIRLAFGDVGLHPFEVLLGDDVIPVGECDEQIDGDPGAEGGIAEEGNDGRDAGEDTSPGGTQCDIEQGFR